MPAKHDMLQALLEKVERNDRNDANYEQFLKLLNWRDSPGKKLNLGSVLAGWGRKELSHFEGIRNQRAVNCY